VVRQPKLIVPADRCSRSRPLGPIKPGNRTRSTDHETPRAAPTRGTSSSSSLARLDLNPSPALSSACARSHTTLQQARSLSCEFPGRDTRRTCVCTVVVVSWTPCKTKFPGLGNCTFFSVTILKGLISRQMFPFFLTKNAKSTVMFRHDEHQNRCSIRFQLPSPAHPQRHDQQNSGTYGRLEAPLVLAAPSAELATPPPPPRC
jgi:hypothetical protein